MHLESLPWRVLKAVRCPRASAALGGIAGHRHRKSIRTRVSRKSLRGLGLKLAKWIKFMWVQQRNQQGLWSNHELKIKTSWYWWENEGMPWTWESRLAMPTYYGGKGACSAQNQCKSPRLGVKGGKDMQHLGSLDHNMAAPPLWWIDPPNLLSIEWPGGRFRRQHW